MKRIAEVLGVSRSNLLVRRSGRTRPRGAYRKADDEGLLPLIRRFVDERPTYGYRRITALVNRELTRKGLPIVNRKRVHRIMQQSALLLEPHTGRREGRIHDGKVMVMRSNLRWCSDGLEFACWNGEIIRMAFIIDAFDREIIACPPCRTHLPCYGRSPDGSTTTTRSILTQRSACAPHGSSSEPKPSSRVSGETGGTTGTKS